MIKKNFRETEEQEKEGKEENGENKEMAELELLRKENAALKVQIAELNQRLSKAENIQKALEYTSEGVLIADTTLSDNPIIFANAAFTKITGYSKGEVIGKNCRFLQGKESDPIIIKQLEEAVKNKTSIKREILNYKKVFFHFFYLFSN